MADTGRSRLQFPATPNSSPTLTSPWVFGWLAWALSVGVWLATLFLRALR